jgi:hypothetical protein
VEYAAFAVPRKEVIKMLEEMLSLSTGDSTPRLIKPVAYNTLGVPKSEIQKVMNDAKATLPTSERMVQRSSTWLFDVAMARSVMGGNLRKTHTESGECEMRSIAEGSIGTAKLNTRRRYTGHA